MDFLLEGQPFFIRLGRLGNHLRFDAVKSHLSVVKCFILFVLAS